MSVDGSTVMMTWGQDSYSSASVCEYAGASTLHHRRKHIVLNNRMQVRSSSPLNLVHMKHLDSIISSMPVENVEHST